MDWGVGMFIHWSFDSGRGCVISLCPVGASDDYVDRYIKELPQYFNPRACDTGERVKVAKRTGFKYVVLTIRHHKPNHRIPFGQGRRFGLQSKTTHG